MNVQILLLSNTSSFLKRSEMFNEQMHDFLFMSPFFFLQYSTVFTRVKLDFHIMHLVYLNYLYSYLQ